MTAATTIHDLQQGSDEWAKFRAVHFGASETAPMLGLSPTMTRGELLHVKNTGIAREHDEWVQENILNHGHRVEAAIRPHMEQIVGDDLYAVTCSKPGSRLSASCDGLTLDGETAWECKQWNAALAAAVEAGNVPDSHMPQCQQILLVTAAKRVIFTVSDGTPERTVYTEVTPDELWFARITAGWEQFAADLAAYTPPAATPVVVAGPVESLPAVSVRMDGSLAVVSNLALFGRALRAFVDKIPEKPSTDQEFADTDAACKALKNAEEALEGAENSALASMASVEEMRRLVADLRTLARTTRLQREKLVSARKAEIRNEQVQRGRTALAEHITSLNTRIGLQIMPAVPVDFGAAIKGKKSIDGVREAIDLTLANAKIEANAVADRIQVNLRLLDQHAEHASLFPDIATIAVKAADDFAALVSSRIAEHERQEAARRQREADAQAARAAAAATPATTPVVAPAPPAVAVAAAPRAAPAPAAADERPTMTLGQIAHRLGFALTADFLRTLGFEATRDRSAALYRPSDFGRICDALVQHVVKAKGVA